MLSIRICNTEGQVIAQGTCSDSGFFPPALASIYNDGLNLAPRRSIEHFGESSGSAEYPVGTRRARFGYSPRRQALGASILDDEVIVHVERIADE
ncbi:MAG: hypothetical protein AB7P40_25105 [Chloroflexota bacterium]